MAMAAKNRDGLLGEGVGIQVPAGRILADRVRWQTVLAAPGKACLYRLFNAAPRRSVPANGMIVEVDGAKRHLRVDPGSSVDVLGKHIRIKAGTGGDSHV